MPRGKPKRKAQGAVYLIPTPLKKKMSMQTKYGRCIICQKQASKNLVPVTAIKSLKMAMEQRDDKVSDRLKTDVTKPDWIAKCSPKWHAHCQNHYTHKKKCMKIAAKRERKSEELQEPKDSDDERTTFDPNNMCFVFGSERYKGKFPDYNTSGTQASPESSKAGKTRCS